MTRSNIQGFRCNIQGFRFGEITLLKKLIDQYRTQKRGLMQKLLSGEWHIKNKEKR